VPQGSSEDLWQNLADQSFSTAADVQGSTVPVRSDAARVTQLLTNVGNTLEADLSIGRAPEAITPEGLEELLREHAHRIHTRHCAAVHEDVLAALARIGRPDGPVTPRCLQRRIHLCLSDVTPTAPTVESLIASYAVDAAFVAEAEQPASDALTFVDHLETAVERLFMVDLDGDGEFDTARTLLVEALSCEPWERGVLVGKAAERLRGFDDMVGEYRLMV